MQIFGVEARCERGRAIQTQAPQPGADFHSAPHRRRLRKPGFRARLAQKRFRTHPVSGDCRRFRAPTCRSIQKARYGASCPLADAEISSGGRRGAVAAVPSGGRSPQVCGRTRRHPKRSRRATPLRGRRQVARAGRLSPGDQPRTDGEQTGARDLCEAHPVYARNPLCSESRARTLFGWNRKRARCFRTAASHAARKVPARPGSEP